MTDINLTGRLVTLDLARRRISGVAVPFGEVIDHGWIGRIKFERGSVRWSEPSRVKLLVDHDPSQPVGYAVTLSEEDAGLVATFTVPDGDAGDQALTDARNGLRDGLSVGVSIDGDPADDGTVTGTLREVSLCAVPAFDNARVTDVAASASLAHQHNPQEDHVPEIPGTIELSAEPVDREARGALVQLTERLADLETNMAAPAPANPFAAFAGLGQYAQAVYSGTADPNLLTLVIADQITSDNPGVLPPSWAQDIKGIVALGRPAVSAFGVESAGSVGLDFSWPYFDGDLAALVGKQATQKTDVTSIKVSLKKGTATLETYAGGSDIAYQLIQRSSPSYLAAYLRIMAAAYAVATDAAFGAALVTAGTAQIGYDIAADNDGSKLAAELFKASVAIETATGAPAGFALVASDVFVKVGAMAKLVAPKYGTQNVPGVAQANTLSVDVNGLQVIHDRQLAAGTILVSNQNAAKWIEDGPRVAEAETPTKLGRDVAVYGFGVAAPYIPKGIIKISKT